MSGCGHDGWQAGCPECETEEELALERIGWPPADGSWSVPDPEPEEESQALSS